MPSNQEIPNDNKLHRLEARLKTFEKTFTINGKRCNWPYKVIPLQAMAQLGFFYHPTVIDDDNTIHKDCVCCIYCRKLTSNFHDCRTKPLNATICKVIEKHLQINPDCLLFRTQLLLIRSILNNSRIDWDKVPSLNCPHEVSAVKLREWTFADNWIYGKDTSLADLKMAQAGLLRYDHDLGNPSLPTEYLDATYCLYCNKIIGSWEKDDDPFWEHFLCSNGGKCYFFETLNDKGHLSELKLRFDQTKTQDVHNLSPSLDYTELLGAKFKRLEDVIINEETKSKRGRPKKSKLLDEAQLIREPKKRGRPRKIMAASQSTPPISDNAEGEDSKTGSFTDCESFAVDKAQGLLGVKRKRGRPKKLNSDGTLENKPKIKRQRGRPRKNTFDGSLESTSSENALSEFQDTIPQENVIKIEPRDSREATTARGNVSPKDSFNASNSLSTESAGNSSTVEALKKDDFVKSPRSTVKPPNISGSPRKKIKLKKQTKVINQDSGSDPSFDDSDTNSNKSIVLNFKARPSTKEAQKNNPIIDDSFDAFSFSNQGNTEFIIPESAFTNHVSELEAVKIKSDSQRVISDMPPIRNNANSSLVHSTASPRFEAHENSDGRLNDIDLNVSLSEDSEEIHILSKSSTPVESPKINTSESSFRRSPEKLEEVRTQNVSGFSRTIALDEFMIHDLSSSSSSISDASSNKSIVNEKDEKASLLKKNSEINGGLMGSDQSVDLLPKNRNGSEYEHTHAHNYDKQQSLQFMEDRPQQPNEESTTIFETSVKDYSNDAPDSTANLDIDYNAKKEDNQLDSKSFLGDITEEPAAYFKKVDDKRKLVKDYFHDLLKYINKNVANLANDKDGDLNFFVSHMPNEELDLTYQSWIDRKKKQLMEEFDMDLKRKMHMLEIQFQKAKELIHSISDEDTLLKISRHSSLPADK